jgi:zeaxanthin glucosyltransferase
MMTHVGLICPAETGHLNTMLSLGQALQLRNHLVTRFAVPDVERKTLAAGLEFGSISEEEFPAGSSPASFAQLGKLSGLAALR